MAVKIERRPFTVHEYYRMAEAGILGEDDRVELIEGEIVEVPPIGSHHASVVKRLNTLLSELARGKAVVSVQDPLQLSDRSEPQPDLMLLQPRPDFYGEFHPRPADVLLLIEVADTTADYDRFTKLPLYARAGIAEVWIIDIGAGEVEMYRAPSAAGYEARQTARRGDEISVDALAGARLRVEEFIGQ